VTAVIDDHDALLHLARLVAHGAAPEDVFVAGADQANSANGGGTLPELALPFPGGD
jgi:hypothetical protein